MAHQFYFNPYILDNLPAPATGFDVVQDISEPRLRMYITSRGVKTFFVRKRVRGKDKRILIGKYPDVFAWVLVVIAGLGVVYALYPFFKPALPEFKKISWLKWPKFLGNVIRVFLFLIIFTLLFLLYDSFIQQILARIF